jgi:hypothetical protein
LPGGLGAGCDLAVIASGVLSADACVAELLAADVGCVSATWLLDMLSQPQARLTGHVLFGTETAVAAAHEKINSARAELTDAKKVDKLTRERGQKEEETPTAVFVRPIDGKKISKAGTAKRGGAKLGKKSSGQDGRAKGKGKAEMEEAAALPPEADDIACGVCGRVDHEEQMVLCDRQGGTCEVAVHIYCMVPALDRVPEGDWFCSICNDEHNAALLPRHHFV